MTNKIRAHTFPVGHKYVVKRYVELPDDELTMHQAKKNSEAICWMIYPEQLTGENIIDLSPDTFLMRVDSHAYVIIDINSTTVGAMNRMLAMYDVVPEVKDAMVTELSNELDRLKHLQRSIIDEDAFTNLATAQFARYFKAWAERASVAMCGEEDKKGSVYVVGTGEHADGGPWSLGQFIDHLVSNTRSMHRSGKLWLK